MKAIVALIVAVGSAALGQEIVRELRIEDVRSYGKLSRGSPRLLVGKVIAVIDEHNVVAGLDSPKDKRDKLKYNWEVWLRCPTAHLKEGRTWDGDEWEKIVGTPLIQVVGLRLWETKGSIQRLPCIEPWKGK